MRDGGDGLDFDRRFQHIYLYDRDSSHRTCFTHRLTKPTRTRIRVRPTHIEQRALGLILQLDFRSIPFYSETPGQPLLGRTRKTHLFSLSIHNFVFVEADLLTSIPHRNKSIKSLLMLLKRQSDSRWRRTINLNKKEKSDELVT